MLDARRRPRGRFFYWLLSVLWIWGIAHAPVVSAGTAPATTRVSDVVYRADSTPASGVVLISWPAFTTADGKPVAAGSTSVNLGAGGSFSADLVPNTGASPAGAYYTVVFQLDDVVRTEYWLVGTISPTTIGAVRATPGSGTASQMVSRQYVDNAVAGRANDASVVHVNGAETIAGTKLFSAPPTVPAPVASTDAVNKAYVDTAVASVGAGSFVAKNGDAMTGPLNLPGDPLSANQATTKHYVDTGLGVKANLVSGVVPAGQLGSGNPDGSLCLKGDSTWGACGTSSNATAIQNVAVDSSTPSDGQVMTYDQASGKYKSKPGVAPASMRSVKYASEYNWQQSPTAPSTLGAGANTITLSPCPNGLFVNAASYTPTQYVYLAGQGTPEAVAATRVSGYSGQSSCQISVTTANTHAAGYTVGSASSGIKEASEAARSQIVSYGSWIWGGTVVVDQAGSPYKVYAPLHFEASWQTINNAGGQIQCYVTNDDCVIVGRRDSQTATQNVVLNDLVINAGNGNTTNFAWDAIHVNAQSTKINNLRIGYSGAGASATGSFNSYISVCDDEAFTVDGLDVMNGYGLRSDRHGQAVYALPEGHARNSNNCYAVGWLKHINGNLQCTGNVVTWLSGNGLRVSDSVVQGFSQYGIRSGTPTGGYNGNTQIDNAYFEVGACTNPDYVAAGATGSASQGMAGVITQGGTVTAHGSTGLVGAMPTFSCSGTAGANQFNYWLVPNNVGNSGYGAPLYFGNTPSNCSGTVTGYFPAIPVSTGTMSYDILRTTGTGNNMAAPYAGGCPGGSVTACGSVIVGNAPGGGTIESFTDNAGANTTAYTVPAIQFVPYLPFWPGNLVLSAQNNTNRTQVPVATYAGEQNLSGGTGIGIVSVNGNYAPSSFSAMGTGGQPGLQGGSAVALGGVSVQLGGFNTATLLMRASQAYSEAANLKGRLNFPGTNLAVINAGSVITIVDSNPDKTIATPNYRPPMDAADVWVGVDNSGSRLNSALAFGSPTSISNYINSLPDGLNYKERLTAALKSFTVPVQAPTINATTGFQVGGSYGASGQCLISTGSGSSWGACSGGASSPLTTKGDLFGFGSANARIPVGTDGQCLVADSTNAVGMKWGSCGTGTAGGALDSAVVHNTGTETVGGDKTFTANVTVQGAMLVAGSWQVESTGPTTPMTGGAGDSKVGFDSDGKLKVSENGAAVTEVAKVSSSITGNAATATSFASAPTKCSAGQAAAGVDASGNAQGCFTPSGGTSSPLTTKGDLWVYGTADSRMAVGGNRSCLVANSSNGYGMVWAFCGTGSSTTKTANYTLTAADDKLLFIFTGSNLTATLPAAIPSGSAVSAWSVTLENTSATPLTVSPNVLTLDGSAASLTLNQYQSATIYTDGANYFSQRGMGVPPGVDVNASGQVTVTHLASALPVAQGGTGFTDTTYQGNTHKVATASGTFASGNLRASDANGNEVDAGVAPTASNVPFIPFNGYNTASTPNTPFSTSANVGGLYGFIIPYTITTSKFAYRVNTADPGSANYGVGIYNSSGTLLLSYSVPATTFAASTGIKSGTWTVNSGTTTLAPGKYYVMFTSGCTASCANFTVSGSTAATFYSNSAFSIAAGGSLPATISAPTGYLESFGAQVLSMVFEP